ncbi:MAG: hypothetical protein ACJ8KF_11460 [Chthoniobacterales bacterium]
MQRRFRKGGYMIDFWGIGFDLAERMNLIPQLRAIVYLIDRMKFVNHCGRATSGFQAEILRRALPNHFFSLLRGDLAEVIFNIFADKIEIIFGDSITAIRGGRIGVDVQFENGCPRRFDVIAGCDGLHSAVRELLWAPTTLGWDYSCGVWSCARRGSLL